MESGRLRLERIADTEGSERVANEVIRRSRREGPKADTIRCECGNPVCHEPLEVSDDDYERARSDSMLFIVARGHEILEAEDVVETNAGYEIVRKHEDMRAVVERSDPRKRGDHVQG